MKESTISILFFIVGSGTLIFLAFNFWKHYTDVYYWILAIMGIVLLVISWILNSKGEKEKLKKEEKNAKEKNTPPKFDRRSA